MERLFQRSFKPSHYYTSEPTRINVGEENTIIAAEVSLAVLTDGVLWYSIQILRLSTNNANLCRTAFGTGVRSLFNSRKPDNSQNRYYIYGRSSPLSNAILSRSSAFFFLIRSSWAWNDSVRLLVLFNVWQISTESNHGPGFRAISYGERSSSWKG